MIAARVPDLSLEQAKALVAQRDAGMWFATEGDFANRLNLPGNRAIRRAWPQSNWFRLAGAARLGSAMVPFQALLARGAKPWPEVLWSREGA